MLWPTSALSKPLISPIALAIMSLTASCLVSWYKFRLGWAVYAAQRLRPQHRSISHPQKIPSKYWVLIIRGRNSKKHNYPRSRMLVADRIMSLRSSNYSSPKKRGYCQVYVGSMGFTDPHRQPPNQNSPSQPACWPCSHWQHPSPM